MQARHTLLTAVLLAHSTLVQAAEPELPYSVSIDSGSNIRIEYNTAHSRFGVGGSYSHSDYEDQNDPGNDGNSRGLSGELFYRHFLTDDPVRLFIEGSYEQRVRHGRSLNTNSFSTTQTSDKNSDHTFSVFLGGEYLYPLGKRASIGAEVGILYSMYRAKYNYTTTDLSTTPATTTQYSNTTKYSGVYVPRGGITLRYYW